MPGIATLPFMMIELDVYGLTAGLLRNVKLPTIAKVIITQVAGRAVRAAAILLAAYAASSRSLPVAVIWTSMVTGAFGIALQWTLLPLLAYRMENRKSHEQ